MSEPFKEDLEQKIDLLKLVGEDTLIGKTIGGHYRVESVLGEGGMGQVYKARHVLIDEDCAIKFLAKDHLRPTDFERFKSEAKTALKLKHPNLASINDFGITEENVPFIVMEYVDGRNLSSELKEAKQFEQNRILDIAIQLCDALNCAHENGILHRDIKPGNVLVKSTGDKEQCKLIDFGIAKSINRDESSPTLTKTGDTIGSPAYMSPEQTEGRQLKETTDIYSLGVLFYELANGKLPFEADSSLTMLLKKLNESPAEFTNKSVSADFKSVVMRCLEREPEQRYQNVKDLRDDLERVKRREKPVYGKKRSSLSVKEKDKRMVQIFTLVCILLATGIFARLSFMSALDKANWKVTCNPGVAEGYITRGRLFSSLGDDRKAVADFNKALEINPNDVMAYVWRSTSNIQLGAYAVALEDAQHAIKLAPTMHQAWIQAAAAENSLGNYENGIADCNKAIELNPKNLYNNHYPAYLNKSIALGRMGKFEEAKECAEKALAFSPAADTYNQMAYLSRNLNKPEEAVHYAQESLKRGENAHAFENLAAAQLTLGHIPEADAAATKAYGWAGPDPFVLSLQGAIRLKQGNMAEAEELSKRALAINKNEKLAKETISEIDKLKIKK